jgi:hypothetical protein
MNFKKLFPSKYLKAVDLDGDTPVTIDFMRVEVVGQGSDADEKPVLYFKGKGQGLVMNVTNGTAIAAIAGEDTDLWPGTEIVLYATMVQFGSKMVDAIRVKAAARPQPQKPQQQLVAAAVPADGFYADTPEAAIDGSLLF